MFGLSPGDEIAIIAGVVIPALAALGALVGAVLRTILRQSKCLELLNHRVENLELDFTRGRNTHAELYERLRHIDVTLASIEARLGQK